MILTTLAGNEGTEYRTGEKMRKEILGWVLSTQPDSENDKQVTENCGKVIILLG